MMCHPAAAEGNTRCNRGIHPQMGLTCTNCHGTMEEHATGLLNAQMENPSSRRLVKNLTTTVSEVKPRTPWIQEPQCLACHRQFKQPARSSSG